METEKILMGQKQLQRWHLMKMVEVGKITLNEAGEKIGVCYWQSKRIRRAMRDKGGKGLIHGMLSKEVYWDFNRMFTPNEREMKGSK
ncbi:MAG: hypothetical protein Q8P64_11680 [Deltaproteobacteria bacterium]|nr:hypothetical protein [Deltaproteobacteria bacterium]